MCHKIYKLEVSLHALHLHSWAAISGIQKESPLSPSEGFVEKMFGRKLLIMVMLCTVSGVGWVPGINGESRAALCLCRVGLGVVVVRKPYKLRSELLCSEGAFDGQNLQASPWIEG